VPDDFDALGSGDAGGLRVVRIPFDTHCWLRLQAAPHRIPADALEALASADNDLFSSAAGAWQVAIEYALGRPPLPHPRTGTSSHGWPRREWRRSPSRSGMQFRLRAFPATTAIPLTVCRSRRRSSKASPCRRPTPNWKRTIFGLAVTAEASSGVSRSAESPARTRRLTAKASLRPRACSRAASRRLSSRPIAVQWLIPPLGPRRRGLLWQLRFGQTRTPVGE